MPPRTAKKAAEIDIRTDRELVYAAREHDMLAFDALFYRYKDGIFRLGLAITKDPSAAEDATEEVTASEERSPSSLAELAELRRVVLAAIDTLGPKHKVVVVLHYLNGLNLAEIAQVVDCPVGTVKSRLHYALRRLRAHLAAHPELGFEPTDASAATPGRIPLTAVQRIRGP